jgi:hypothetical protein
MYCVIAAFAFLFLISARPASAQDDGRTFQATVQFAGADSGEFDSTDRGVGGRVSWHPLSLVGVEAELDYYPGDFADEPAFSSSRVEGLFGATVGPRIGPFRPFAKLRPGFVAFREAPEPFACILIFPPPLACQLAVGRTVFALDVGGGLEWLPSDRTVVRIDAGDRAMRYPGPILNRDGSIENETFFGHDFRFAIGGGVRF